MLTTPTMLLAVEQQLKGLRMHWQSEKKVVELSRKPVTTWYSPTSGAESLMAGRRLGSRAVAGSVSAKPTVWWRGTRLKPPRPRAT